MEYAREMAANSVFASTLDLPEGTTPAETATSGTCEAKSELFPLGKTGLTN